MNKYPQALVNSVINKLLAVKSDTNFYVGEANQYLFNKPFCSESDLIDFWEGVTPKQNYNVANYVLELVKQVTHYEKVALGKVVTDITDMAELLNMCFYIVGNDLLSERKPAEYLYEYDKDLLDEGAAKTLALKLVDFIEDKTLAKEIYDKTILEIFNLVSQETGVKMVYDVKHTNFNNITFHLGTQPANLESGSYLILIEKQSERAGLFQKFFSDNESHIEIIDSNYITYQGINSLIESFKNNV